MDITRLKRNTERRMKVDSSSHKKSKEIKNCRDRREVIQYESRESFKPIIDT